MVGEGDKYDTLVCKHLLTQQDAEQNAYLHHGPPVFKTRS
jgi:hypothetical protein